MNVPESHTVELQGLRVEYRLRTSTQARRLRVRVGLGGVDVIRPKGRSRKAVESFLEERSSWILAQQKRLSRYEGLRRERVGSGRLPYRGQPMEVRLVTRQDRSLNTTIEVSEGEILIRRSTRRSTKPHRSLENWLRCRAKKAVHEQLDIYLPRLRVAANRVYVMDQRTKWGNCSSLGNLSFNWRLVLAPAFVLNYIVAHEATHLSIPDHSQRYWLLLQSLFPETERARQWLCANGAHLLDLDLGEFVPAISRAS